MPRRFFEAHLTQEEIDRGKGILRRRVMENNYRVVDDAFSTR